MSKQDDPLTSLWQSQPVQIIDPEELKTMWQKNRKRQWLWVLSDVASMLIALLLCIRIVVYEENLFVRIWGGLFMVFALFITPFIVKLRYKSLGGSVPTSEYLERLIEQKRNNILMVRLSTWTCIGVCVLYAIWSNAYYFYYDPTPVEHFYRILRSSALVLLLTVGFAIWGKYEISKNSRELHKFSKMSRQSED